MNHTTIQIRILDNNCYPVLFFYYILNTALKNYLFLFRFRTLLDKLHTIIVLLKVSRGHPE